MKLVVAVLALMLGLCAEAQALPGDQPIVPRSPADGVTVPANALGIAVTYDCPTYRAAVYSSGNTAYPDYRDHEAYEVQFSNSPVLGGDGRLASQPYGSNAGARLNPDGTTCTSALDTYDTASSPEIAGGRVYWQASRYCNGCGASQREFAPVQSFVVRPASVKASLKAPAHPYAGYLNVFTLKTKAPLSGAKVALQRRSGKRWKTIDRVSFRLGATELVAKLPAGRQLVRARVETAARSFTAAHRTVKVRRSGRRTTSRRDDGSYAARKAAKNATLRFQVGSGGTQLRRFKASVTTFCIGPSLADNRIYVGFALLNTVRVAPDGAVTGLLRTKKGGQVLLTGRLHKRRFKGSVSQSFSTCNGTRKLDATRR